MTMQETEMPSTNIRVQVTFDIDLAGKVTPDYKQIENDLLNGASVEDRLGGIEVYAAIPVEVTFLDGDYEPIGG